MSSGPELQAPPVPKRSFAPILRGAGLGFLFGALLGALTWLELVLPASNGLSTSRGAESFFELAELTAIAGVIGGLYGTVVGAIAGFGAVIVVERSRARRIAVASLTLFVGVLTVACLVSTNPRSDPAAVLRCLPQLAIMTLIAWWLAPRLDGRRTRLNKYGGNPK